MIILIVKIYLEVSFPVCEPFGEGVKPTQIISLKFALVHYYALLKLQTIRSRNCFSDLIAHTHSNTHPASLVSIILKSFPL